MIVLLINSETNVFLNTYVLCNARFYKWLISSAQIDLACDQPHPDPKTMDLAQFLTSECFLHAAVSLVSSYTQINSYFRSCNTENLS